MTVSIIIPTRNRPQDLRRFLSLLVPQLPDDESVDIHVCDDSDGTATKALLEKEYPNVVWHAGPKKGPGANRNVGASAAGASWLIFFDDDCLPYPGALKAYLDAMSKEQGDVALAGPTYRTGANRKSLLWEAPGSASPGEILPPSCNFAIPRELFLRAGRFDERYRISFEDMEFFARLHLLGVPVRFVAEAAVDHPVRPLPPPAKLALRWEARVISCLDLGATVPQVLWRLPRHIIMVIKSRFRGRKPDIDSLRAAGIFLAEFIITLCYLPGWLAQQARAYRNPFWAQQVAAGRAPKNFGL